MMFWSSMNHHHALESMVKIESITEIGQLASRPRLFFLLSFSFSSSLFISHLKAKSKRKRIPRWPRTHPARRQLLGSWHSPRPRRSSETSAAMWPTWSLKEHTELAWLRWVLLLLNTLCIEAVIYSQCRRRSVRWRSSCLRHQPY